MAASWAASRVVTRAAPKADQRVDETAAWLAVVSVAHSVACWAGH